MASPKIKKSVKAAVAKFEKAKELQKELAELESELAEYGLYLTKTKVEVAAKKTRSARKSYPELTVEAAKEFIKEKGSKVSASDFAAHFGVKFQTWRKTHEKSFKVTKEGTSKFWESK